MDVLRALLALFTVDVVRDFGLVFGRHEVVVLVGVWWGGLWGGEGRGGGKKDGEGRVVMMMIWLMNLGLATTFQSKKIFF